MKIAFVIFFAIFCASVAADCSADNVKSVQACYLSLFKRYGLNFMPDYNTYISTVQNFLNRNGVSGLTTVQGWIKTRMTCLQPYVPDCVSIEEFRKVFSTDNYTIAGEWATIRPIEDWEYTDGFGELVNNHDCMVSIKNDHAGDIQVCSTNMTSAFQNGFTCQIPNDFITCMTNVYNKYCGKSASDFMCQATTISMNFNFPQCSSGTPKCPGSSKNLIGKFAKMLHLRKNFH